jgi:methylmalonyl-CoA mutase N-terminal domain/subunit
MSWDEALALPSEEAALVALRTQQIIAYESGVTRTVDPLGGSWYLEELTDELERRARALLDEVERTGVVAGIRDGTLERAIADAAYREQAAVEGGDHVVVGVNRFAGDAAADPPIGLLAVPDSVRDRQLDRLASVRAARDAGAVDAALEAVGTAAASGENVMPAVLGAVRAYATVGEITDRMVEVFGRHQPSMVT